LHYNGSVSSALLDSFPNIGLDDSKFHTVRRMLFFLSLPIFSSPSPLLLITQTGHHWKLESNRRHFFEQLAEKNHFDPLNPINWYSFPTHEILEQVFFSPPFFPFLLLQLILFRVQRDYYHTIMEVFLKRWLSYFLRLA
jgi:hypothetical protein